MENLKSLNIKLIKKNYRSDFLQELLEDELEKTLKEKKMVENSLNFLVSYFYQGKKEIEFGVFILNKTSEEIDIEEFPFYIVNEKKEIIKRVDNNIKEKIKVNEASFHEIKVEIEQELVNNKELNLVIGKSENLVIEEHYKVEVKNLEPIKKYSAIRALKKFTRSLPLIKKNQLRADLYSITSEGENIIIILYFRNSSNRDISIKSLPLNIYTKNNLLAYRDVLLLEDDSFIIPKESGVFFRKTLKAEDFPVEGLDIEKCRVDFIR